MVAPSKEDLNAPIPSRLPRTQVRTGQNGSVALAEALAHTRSFATYENRVGCISCDSSVDASACAGETEGGSDDGKVGAPVPCAVSPSGTDAMAAEPPATRSTTKGKGTPPAAPRSPHAPRRHAPSQRPREYQQQLQMRLTRNTTRAAFDSRRACAIFETGFRSNLSVKK